MASALTDRNAQPELTYSSESMTLFDRCSQSYRVALRAFAEVIAKKRLSAGGRTPDRIDVEAEDVVHAAQTLSRVINQAMEEAGAPMRAPSDLLGLDRDESEEE